MIRLRHFGCLALCLSTLAGCGLDRTGNRPMPDYGPKFADGIYLQPAAEAQPGSVPTPSPVLVVRTRDGKQRLLILDHCGEKYFFGSFHTRSAMKLSSDKLACHYRITQTPNGLSLNKTVPGERLDRTLELVAQDEYTLGGELIQRHQRLLRSTERFAEQSRQVIENFFRRVLGKDLPKGTASPEPDPASGSTPAAPSQP